MALFETLVAFPTDVTGPVKLAFVVTLLAVPVRFPTKPVAVKIPVLGLNESFVLEDLTGKAPPVPVVHSGKTVAFVVVSFAMVEVDASVAVAAKVAVAAFPLMFV